MGADVWGTFNLDKTTHNYLQYECIRHSGWIVMQWMEFTNLQMHCTIWQCDGNGMECDGAAAMGTDTAERRMDGDMAIGNASTLDEMGWLYCLKRDATLDHDARCAPNLTIRTTHPQILDDYCSNCTLANTQNSRRQASRGKGQGRQKGCPQGHKLEDSAQSPD